MASTYSDLKIELIGTGEQVGTWGNTTNTNLGTALGEAITGSATVTFSSADVTLTLSNTNGSQTARNLRLVCAGTSGGARNLILGSGCQIDKLYLIQNDLADTVTVKNTTGTGVAVLAGAKVFVFNDGTNVVTATNLTGTSGTLPIVNGGTGATDATTALSNLGGVTTAGARAALSFAAGSGAYNSGTGVITIPTNNNQIANGSGFTTNTGTVTSVSGTGTASGLSLSGNVTTTGNLTLSGTVNSLAAGTYGISISGNAATATSAATWTTARTITIGATGKSVNGSSNVSWSLGEIGAGNMSVDTNTSASATSYAIGTNLFYMKTLLPGAGLPLNSTVTPLVSLNTDGYQTGVFQEYSLTVNAALSGTWRVRGGFLASEDGSQPTLRRSNQQSAFRNGFIVLIQRTA